MAKQLLRPSWIPSMEGYFVTLSGCPAGGVFKTDVSNAARTCLMDIRTLRWDPALLARFQLSEAMLPRICSNAEVYGHVRDGPLAGVPIAGRDPCPLAAPAEALRTSIQ